MKHIRLIRKSFLSFCTIGILSSQSAWAITCADLPLKEIRRGDLIFTEIDNFLYRRVARVSNGWTSHVGMIHEHQGQWVVYESRPPKSVRTPLCEFVNRNKGARFAISRLSGANQLSDENLKSLKAAAEKRLNVRYDLHFDYDDVKSSYCSKFVDAVFRDVLKTSVGLPQTLGSLLGNLEDAPKSDLKFWKIWFGGRIPYEQRTLSPQSQFDDPEFEVWFDSES